MEDDDGRRGDALAALCQNNGIFTSEYAQLIVRASVQQVAATLGAAWTECAKKEDTLALLGKCLDLVPTWNEETFRKESERCFGTMPRVAECLRDTFVAFAREVYRDPKTRLRVTVPSNAVYVRALLLRAATHPRVRSGALFAQGGATSLEGYHTVTQLVRSTFDDLSADFVFVQEPEPPPPAARAVTAEDVRPGDSVSQVVSGSSASSSSSSSSSSKKSSSTKHTSSKGHQKTSSAVSAAKTSATIRSNDSKRSREKTTKAVTVMTNG